MVRYDQIQILSSNFPGRNEQSSSAYSVLNIPLPEEVDIKCENPSTPPSILDSLHPQNSFDRNLSTPSPPPLSSLSTRGSECNPRTPPMGQFIIKTEQQPTTSAAVSDTNIWPTVDHSNQQALVSPTGSSTVVHQSNGPEQESLTSSNAPEANLTPIAVPPLVLKIELEISLHSATTPITVSPQPARPISKLVNHPQPSTSLVQAPAQKNQAVNSQKGHVISTVVSSIETVQSSLNAVIINNPHSIPLLPIFSSASAIQPETSQNVSFDFSDSGIVSLSAESEDGAIESGNLLHDEQGREFDAILREINIPFLKETILPSASPSLNRAAEEVPRLVAVTAAPLIEAERPEALPRASEVMALLNNESTNSQTAAVFTCDSQQKQMLLASDAAFVRASNSQVVTNVTTTTPTVSPRDSNAAASAQRANSNAPLPQSSPAGPATASPPPCTSQSTGASGRITPSMPRITTSSLSFTRNKRLHETSAKTPTPAKVLRQSLSNRDVVANKQPVISSVNLNTRHSSVTIARPVSSATTTSPSNSIPSISPSGTRMDTSGVQLSNNNPLRQSDSSRYDDHQSVSKKRHNFDFYTF